jgi:hypothetical protein
MVSRRVVVGGGAAVVAAGAGLHLAGRDDDVLRALGARPRPTPDPADTALLGRIADEQEALLGPVAALEGVETADLVAVLTTQLQALGMGDREPSTRTTAGAQDVDAVATEIAAASRRRQRDALEAVSPDLGRLLASLAAGQAQVARVLRTRAAEARP